MKRLAVALAFLALAGRGAGAVAPVVTVKLATLAPDGSPWHELLKDLGARWREVSGGKVELKGKA